MTRDDIMRMSREAVTKDDGEYFSTYEYLERFAALVAAAERAACADICDQHASIEGIAQQCAAEIRARGNK